MKSAKELEIQEKLGRIKGLIAGVVIQSLDDYQAELKAGGIIHAEMSEPGRWLLSDERNPWQFVWACDVLGFDPNGIRMRLNTRSLLSEMRRMRDAQSRYARRRMQAEMERP